MRRGDAVKLTVPIASHEDRRPTIPAGTAGTVLGLRHLPDDPAPMALVKFKGWGTPRSLQRRFLEVAPHRSG